MVQEAPHRSRPGLLNRTSMHGSPGPAPALRVTMVRYSTLLLQWDRCRILTDPFFRNYMRGLPFLRKPGLQLREIPELNGILVSHIHPGHFDRNAIGLLHPLPGSVFLPPGSLVRLGDKDPTWCEVKAWTTYSVGPVHITAVPAMFQDPESRRVHYVLRFPNLGLVFFGGHARFDGNALWEVVRRFGPFRLALLPVAGTRLLGRQVVMGPADAERAADILRATTVMPIHEGGNWLSFPPISLHPGRYQHLEKALLRRGEAGRVVILKDGDTASFR